jgi:TIR domain
MWCDLLHYLDPKGFPELKKSESGRCLRRHSQPNQAMDIFLSYNSADHSFMENIARKLSDEGLEPFLDRWDLVPGMRWRSGLEKKLSSSRLSQSLWARERWDLGNSERWTSHSTFRLEARISPSYRCYSRAVNLHWAFLGNSPGWIFEPTRSTEESSFWPNNERVRRMWIPTTSLVTARSALSLGLVVGSPALSNKRSRCKARTLRLQAIR